MASPVAHDWRRWQARQALAEWHAGIATPALQAQHMIQGSHTTSADCFLRLNRTHTTALYRIRWYQIGAMWPLCVTMPVNDDMLVNADREGKSLQIAADLLNVEIPAANAQADQQMQQVTCKAFGTGFSQERNVSMQGVQ